jgi:hypothetical protein
MKKIAVLAAAAFLGTAGVALAEPVGVPYTTAQDFAVRQDVPAAQATMVQDRSDAGYAAAPSAQDDYSISR